MSILPFFKRSSVPIEAPQKPEALPDAPSVGADSAAVKAHDYLCNILGLNDVQAKILTVVMTEVSGVRSDIDNNFVELSTRFTHLAQVSRDQTQFMQELASNTDTIQVGDKALPIGEVAETMGHTLSEFVEKIVFMSSRSVNMVYTLDDVMAQIEQVEASIKSIDRINTQTNMLAINAKIEAVHAGELGAGFGIVADEVRELARSVGALSSDLKSRIGIISQGLHKGYDLLREIAEVDTSGQNLAVNQSINNMMRALVDQSVSLKTMLETSADAAESITGDISEAIVRMQFQDRATQRLETAVTAVQTLVDAMGKADTEARSTLSLVNGTAYGEALSEDVLAQCTLGSVHDSLLTSLGRVKTGDASLRGQVHVQAAGDVELF